jgi:hypothetical protein
MKRDRRSLVDRCIKDITYQATPRSSFFQRKTTGGGIEFLDVPQNGPSVNQSI